MTVHARFVAGDHPGDLSLAMAALGLPPGAGDLVGAAVVSGHLLVTGAGPEAVALLGEAAAVPNGPKLTPGPSGALLLSGRLEAIRRAGEALRRREDLPEVAEAGGKILRACFHAGRDPEVRIGDLAVGGANRPAVMAIVNVTPDSFSDGGRYLDPDRALAHAEELVAAGADLLDIGGESTRPRGSLYGEGARPVPVEEEVARVVPAVERIARALPHVPISVDTSRAEVAARALDAGARLVNDVRGLSDDELARVVARSGAACCLMHTPGEPSVMAGLTDYDDVVGEVADALCTAVERAVDRGVSPDRILVDPGFGFGKTAGQNLFLHRQLVHLKAATGRPVLVGTSRKGFLGKVTGREVSDRDRATAASCAAAILAGAAVVRVHDVAACLDAVRVAGAIAAASEGGRLFDGMDR
jgi:dihydropteroate synthase